MFVSLDIMKCRLHLPTTHDIWNTLAKACSDESDELQVFSLNQRAFAVKQNG